MNGCVAWEKKIETNEQGLLSVLEFEKLPINQAQKEPK